jgi:hypothetical protein
MVYSMWTRTVNERRSITPDSSSGGGKVRAAKGKTLTDAGCTLCVTTLALRQGTPELVPTPFLGRRAVDRTE